MLADLVNEYMDVVKKDARMADSRIGYASPSRCGLG